MNEDLENWMSIIRSCVITSKTPLRLAEINNDVKMLEGRDIPFRQFHFSSLQKMIESTPGLNVFKTNGTIYVQVIPTEKTKHIAKMVHLQKSAKKKKNNNNFKLKAYLNQKAKMYNMAKNFTANKNNYKPPVQKLPQTAVSGTQQKSTIAAPMATSTPQPARKCQKPLNIPQPSLQPPKNPPNAPFQERNNYKTYRPRNNYRQTCAPYPARNNMWQQLPSKLDKLREQYPNPCQQLFIYTQSEGLPHPYYEVIHGQSGCLYGIVMLGTRKFSTYPRFASTQARAKWMAAIVAINNLKVEETILDYYNWNKRNFYDPYKMTPSYQPYIQPEQYIQPQNVQSQQYIQSQYYVPLQQYTQSQQYLQPSMYYTVQPTWQQY